LSDRAVRELVSRGVLAGRSGKGWDLDRCRVQYIRHVREQAAGRRGDGPLDLAQERAALSRAQRRALEAKARREAGDYVLVADHEREVIRLATTVSSRLQGVPSAIAPELFAAASAAECEAICVRAVDDALRDMAERAQRDLTRLEAATREEIQNDDE